MNVDFREVKSGVNLSQYESSSIIKERLFILAELHKYDVYGCKSFHWKITRYVLSIVVDGKHGFTRNSWMGTVPWNKWITKVTEFELSFGR